MAVEHASRKETCWKSRSLLLHEMNFGRVLDVGMLAAFQNVRGAREPVIIGIWLLGERFSQVVWPWMVGNLDAHVENAFGGPIFVDPRKGE